MPEHVLRSNKGVGLVEVMVAMVVLLLVFLAMIQTSLVGMDANVRNLLRGEATSVAEEGMSTARNAAFASLVSDPAYVAVMRNVRSVTGGVRFNRLITVTELDGDGNLATDDGTLKQVNVTVSWDWKGDNYTHRISTIRKR